MAEIKTGIFAKNVQKRLNRAQEKVLQKLGKADETKDEQFEQVVINFRRQESEGSRLQREMKAYMSAIKGMQQASINLTQSLHEVYEPDWHGKDDVMTIGKDCDALWEDFHNKLVDSTLLNLDAYLQQFPDLKTRVAKRSRKLIDYDSARHHVETLQASGIKNDRKMMKAEEELKKAQRVFDELNVGLQDELPTLWDSRVGFYIRTYKSVTSLEAKFHREISLVCRQLYEVMTKLGEQHSDKMFTIQGAPSDSGPLRLARTPSPPEDESPPESPDASSNHMLRPVSPGPPRPKSPTQFKKGPPVPPPPKVTPTKEVAEEQIIDLFGGEFLPAPSPSQVCGNHTCSLIIPDMHSECVNLFTHFWFAFYSPMNDQENLFLIWTLMLFSQMKVFHQYHRFSALTDTGPKAFTIHPQQVVMVFFFLQVETMHDFEAANSDELELKRGDVVLVVPTASVEDQDAGWLTGIKEHDWLTLGASAQKGLFPENFTQRLE
uniref:Amphiphysin n=1 Tax=Lates calcarifer TaxID=8187 RepID=A0A4W6CNU2_LATCA